METGYLWIFNSLGWQKRLKAVLRITTRAIAAVASKVSPRPAVAIREVKSLELHGLLPFKFPENRAYDVLLRFLVQVGMHR